MKKKYDIFIENEVVKSEKCFLIKLNLTEDFPFDIENIHIKYDEENNKVEVYSEEIPRNIKENMIKYYKNDINFFIMYIQENIEIFLKGEIPLDEMNNEMVDGSTYYDFIFDEKLPYILPETFIFPVNDIKSLNIEYTCVKKNINFVTATNINIQGSCLKCKKTQNISTTKHCISCNNELYFNYAPTLNKTFLGKLMMNDITFICFNEFKFQLSCQICGLAYQTDKIGVQKYFTVKCYKCKSKLDFSPLSLEYKTKTKNSYKLEHGSTLPVKGTCKHYSKSFRWFRFPCCRQLFPCDICHDQNSDHVFQMANKMVCGFCSKEQSCKEKCDCGMNINRSTSHWEGGKGARNKTTMSKKDNKKYKK